MGIDLFKDDNGKEIPGQGETPAYDPLAQRGRVILEKPGQGKTPAYAGAQKVQGAEPAKTSLDALFPPKCERKKTIRLTAGTPGKLDEEMLQRNLKIQTGAKPGSSSGKLSGKSLSDNDKLYLGCLTFILIIVGIIGVFGIQNFANGMIIFMAIGFVIMWFEAVAAGNIFMAIVLPWMIFSFLTMLDCSK